MTEEVIRQLSHIGGRREPGFWWLTHNFTTWR
jgi:hypothetical protein